jgi:hypothetical protein
MKKIGLMFLLAILASLLAPTIVSADGPWFWPKELKYTILFEGKTYDLGNQGLRDFFRWVSYEGKGGEIFIYDLYQRYDNRTSYKKMWLTAGGVWFWEKIDPERGVFQRGSFQEWDLGAHWYHDFLIFW